jgi:hypothetical protein
MSSRQLEWVNIRMRSKSSTSGECSNFWDRIASAGLGSENSHPLLFSGMHDRSNAPLRKFSLQVCYCENEFGVLFLNAVNDFKLARVNIPVVFARSTRHLLFQSLALLKDFSTERQRLGRNRG